MPVCNAADEAAQPPAGFPPDPDLHQADDDGTVTLRRDTKH
jgi:hypothetical protein